MDIEDARRLSPEAQQALRRRAVSAVVDDGLSQGEVAKRFGVSRAAVNQWVQRYRAQGEQALAAQKRGRPSEPRLKPHQAATICNLIRDRCPDQLKLPFALWTRDAVAQLIEERFGIRLARTTVGYYLRRWGLSPQKPAARAREQRPEAVQAWLDEAYPAIRARAQREGAEIHWGDEAGLRSDHQAGTCWAPKGETPVIPRTGQRFSCNMISTLTNRGTLRFQVFTGRFTADVFIDFLRRLVRQSDRKVFLVVDRHPVHRARRVKDWLAKHADDIELFFLPPYSPERNPDEFLNQDVKTNAVGRNRPRNATEMVQTVRAYLHRVQQWPDRVRRYFHAGPVQYAAQ